MSNVSNKRMIEPVSSGVENRSRGFRLKAELQPLSDLLGTVVEASVSKSPTSSGRSVDWTTVDGIDGDRQQREDEPK